MSAALVDLTRGYFRSLSPAAVLPVAALLLGVSGAASAAEESGGGKSEVKTFVEVRAGATHSDNLRRVPVNEENGTIYNAGLGLDLTHAGRRLDVATQANLDWRKYPSDTFESDVFGHFNGEGSWRFADSFRWNVFDTYGQMVTDPFAAPQPDNLESVNYFTTGPSFLFRMGPAYRLGIDGTYSMTNYETTTADSEQLRGGVAVVRELSSSSTVSLNATAQTVEFDDATLNPKHQQRQAFVRYAGTNARNTLAADLGYSQIEILNESSDGVLARVSLVRLLTPSSTLALTLSNQFSSAGDLFRERLDSGGGSEVAASIASGDAFEQRGATVNWSFHRGRNSFGVGAAHSEELYELSPQLDRKSTVFDAFARRQLRRSLSLRLVVRQEQEDFKSLDFEDKETSVSAVLDWQFGRKMGLAFRYGWNDRNSSDPATEYSEQQLGINLFYRPVNP